MEPKKKKKLNDLFQMKRKGQKVAWITSYDCQMARIAEAAGIDMILVGDSAGNNLLGYADTIPVTMEEMIILSKAVRRGAPNTFIIGDMPLGSYQASNAEAIHNALRFLKEAGMDAVKCEGGKRMAERIRAMTDSGIAVFGHIGYTPQSTDFLGIVQSKSLEGFKGLLEDACAVQEAGASAILLEAVPTEPAGLVAKQLSIPVYAIGAGRHADGVLAIVNDVVGIGTFRSKFAKRFCSAEEVISAGISSYIREVRSEQFPQDDYCYSTSGEELEKIQEYVAGLNKRR